MKIIDESITFLRVFFLFLGEYEKDIVDRSRGRLYVMVGGGKYDRTDQGDDCMRWLVGIECDRTDRGDDCLRWLVGIECAKQLRGQLSMMVDGDRVCQPIEGTTVGGQ